MTDIHGDDKGMDLLLKQAQVDFTRDLIVFGGDMIDRGKESAKVVKRIKQLVDAYPEHVQALIGNHEEMARDYYRSGDNLWLRHGGRETIRDFEKTFSKADMDEHIEWMSNLPLVYEDEGFVYTHAGLNPFEALNHQSRDILWMSEADFYSISKDHLHALTMNRPVVHGHTPVERIYFDGCRLGCDLGSNTYSITEERGLGLVNLDQMIYYAYKPFTGKIEERSIMQY